MSSGLILSLALVACRAEGPPPEPPRASKADVQKAIERGRAFLSSQEQQDGSWLAGIDYTKDTTYGDAAVTALALRAMWRTGGARDSKGALKTLEAKALTDGPEAPTAVRPFALAYGLLAALEGGHNRRLAQDFVDKICSLPGKGRGLSYSGGSKEASFELALLLWSLAEAKRSGLSVPERTMHDLKRSIEKTRVTHEGDVRVKRYGYSTESADVECGAGSSGRSVLCEFALMRASGSETQEDCRDLWNTVRRHLNYVPDMWETLSMPKWDHEVPHAGADRDSQYYYFFSFYHASEALKQLALVDPEDACPLDEGRSFRTKKDESAQASRLNLSHALAHHILAGQRENGSWRDSEYSGPVAGTAFAMLALKNVEPLLE